MFVAVDIDDEHVLGRHVENVLDGSPGLTGLVNHCQPPQLTVPELFWISWLLIGLDVNHQHRTSQLLGAISIGDLLEGDNQATPGPSRSGNCQLPPRAFDADCRTNVEPLVGLVGTNLDDDVSPQTMGTPHPADDNLHCCLLFHCDS